MPKKLTTAEFILKARQVHGWRYDYSKVNYITAQKKVCIICPKHGEFLQSPNAHLRGQGCPKCGRIDSKGNKKYDTVKFIEKARKIHGEKYDYSKINYINSKTKMEIICPKHGSFFQNADNHFLGKGCPICANETLAKSKIKGISYHLELAKKKHNNYYDYSLVGDCVKVKDKIKIICPKHGVFEQVLDLHKRGQGCPICANEMLSIIQRDSTQSFVNKAKLIHGDKYDYSRVKYNKSNIKVDIICPKHGSFKQSPNKHLMGEGCPLCKNSIGENIIERYLTENNIYHIRQYKVELDYKLFSRNKLRIDFYLPTYKMFIEFNGGQHYIYIPMFHKTEEDFQKQVERDKRLKQYCKDNKIKLIVIKYNQIDKIEEILNKKLKVK